MILILPGGALADSEANSAEFPEAASLEAAVPEAGSPEVGRFFVLANLEFTLLHEFSHMLIEELDLPVLGTEEDAADRIAIIVMLKARQHQSAEEVIPWLFAVAGDWYTEWELKDRPSGRIDYSDNHHLEIQRFHNILCLIYCRARASQKNWPLLCLLGLVCHGRSVLNLIIVFPSPMHTGIRLRHR